MKTFTKFALASAVGLTLASAAAFAQPAPQDPPSAPAGAPVGPPPGRGLGLVLKGILEKYDANNDGQLDKSELDAMRQDIDAGKVQPPFGPRGGRRGPGGPAGEPGGNPADPQARGPHGPGPDGQGFGPPKDILDKYDVNKNGRLDPEEREALHQDVRDGKIAPPQGRPFPPRGPEGAGRPGQAGPGAGPGNPPSPQEVLRRFDTDKDGLLNEQELGALLRELRPHRFAMQGRGRPAGPEAPERPQPPTPPEPPQE